MKVDIINDRKVNFVVIGAERAGSSTLYRYLQKHPNVCMSTVKEPGYFAYNLDWQKNLCEYHKLFSFSKDLFCGEASTMYTWFPEYPHTARSLFEYNPGLKLIYLIRNPVSRMISQYSMWTAWGVIKKDPMQLINNPVFVNRSRYWLQLHQYLYWFPQENIHLMISEDLFTNPDLELKRLLEFLNIPIEHMKMDAIWENPSVGQTLELWKFKKFKRHKWVKWIIPKIPALLRDVLRKPFERSIQEKPTIHPDILDVLWRMIEDDVCEIEKYIDRKLTFWHPQREQG